MRAAILTAHGTPSYGTFREPAAEADGQVVVDVAAAGVNPIDLLAASGGGPGEGAPLPRVAGAEGVGLVEGRRVYFGRSVAPFGSMAERALVERSNLYPVPGGLEDGLAVALGIAGLAGWLALEWRAKLQPGEHVLVLGASGLVGQFAVQAARHLGAGRIVAVGRSVSGLARARELGAEVVDVTGHEEPGELSARLRSAAEDRVDVIIDPIWGPVAMAALGAASTNARLVQLGHSAAREVPFAPVGMRRTLISILGFSNGSVPAEVRRETYGRMADLAAGGALSAPVESLALDHVAEAWERQRRSPNAKLVLVP